MPTKKLTDLFVERVKPPGRGRVEYFDAAFPGLALRVTDTGAKSWSLHYRMGGRLRRLTIGAYPAIKPALARRAAIDALGRVREGVDPADEKRARRDARPPESDTFGAVAHDYLERHLSRNCSRTHYRESKRDLERNVLPEWGRRPIARITRRDVLDLVDGIVVRGADIAANRTLARVRALFNWAIENDRVAASPVERIKPPTKESARDRVLTDDEIRLFWPACDELGWPFGPLFKLLLLTAQRRDEVAGMAWTEIDADKRIWTMPRERSKNARGHEVQLCEAAIGILRELPRIAANGDLVFSTNGERPVSGFSRAKDRLHETMRRTRQSADAEISDWTLHDLRRTAATGMARLNIPPHVVDRILNHVSGTIRGVAAIYNRHGYTEERRAALEAWGRYVSNLVTQARASNVVILRV